MDCEKCSGPSRLDSCIRCKNGYKYNSKFNRCIKLCDTHAKPNPNFVKGGWDTGLTFKREKLFNDEDRKDANKWTKPRNITFTNNLPIPVHI